MTILLKSLVSQFSPITEAQLSHTLDQLQERTPMVCDYLFEGWYHEGDLHLPHSVSCGLTLVVNGNVTIDGSFDDYEDSGLLVVLGNLTVHNLFCIGGVAVLGDLNASGLVCTQRPLDSFEVGGALSTRAMIVSNKYSDYRIGNIDLCIDHSLGRHGTQTDEDYEQAVTRASDVFAPEVVDLKSNHSMIDKLRAAVAAGRSVWR
jgi:hypothetical protein